MKNFKLPIAILAMIIAVFIFHNAHAAYNNGGSGGGGTGTSNPGEILWNNPFSPNTVGGLVIGSGLTVTTTAGVSTLSSNGGGGIPVTAIIEETGTPILTETGTYIVEE